jgi:predicted esterase
MLRQHPLSALIVCSLTLVLARASRASDDDLLTVEGQPQQQYYLIGADEDVPKDKPRGLLIVMPGGDGSAEFHGFVVSIRETLPKDYLVAQLFAVPTDDPEQVVWPTEKLKHRKQTFTTQQFIENIVKEVKAKHKLDENRIFALGWSSSGGPTYASVLTPNSPVKGAIVAMSVFQLQFLPPLTGAKGRRFVIMHPVGDKLIPIRAAETAKKRLSAAGAQVEFVRMAGGHGWHDNPLGRIKRAVTWLENKPKK